MSVPEQCQYRATTTYYECGSALNYMYEKTNPEAAIVCVFVCVCVCVRACVRAFVRACLCVRSKH